MVDMLGTGLRFGALRGEDRFYIPVKARKNQREQKQGRRGNKGDDSETKDPSNSLPITAATNLDRFLDSTKPLVPAQYFSKVDLLSCLIFVLH